MQIIANLSNVLSITLPTVFADFIDLIASWFRFDILELFSLGCLSSGSYVSSLVVNFILVVVVSLSVGLLYMWEVRQSDREDFGKHSDQHTEHLRALYDQFDVDGQGITVTEMRAVVLKINPEADDDDQIQQLL